MSHLGADDAEAGTMLFLSEWLLREANGKQKSVRVTMEATRGLQCMQVEELHTDCCMVQHKATLWHLKKK